MTLANIAFKTYESSTNDALSLGLLGGKVKVTGKTAFSFEMVEDYEIDLVRLIMSMDINYCKRRDSGTNRQKIEMISEWLGDDTAGFDERYAMLVKKLVSNFSDAEVDQITRIVREGIIIEIFNLRYAGLHAEKDDTEMVQIILKDYFGLYKLRNRILTMLPTKLIREITVIKE